jgi:hypothetical protein
MPKKMKNKKQGPKVRVTPWTTSMSGSLRCEREAEDHPRAEPDEILGDSPHGERNPRAWISLTMCQTGVGAPGCNGTRHREPWKTFT